jgi:hypothetical protein
MHNHHLVDSKRLQSQTRLTKNKKNQQQHAHDHNPVNQNNYRIKYETKDKHMSTLVKNETVITNERHRA